MCLLGRAILRTQVETHLVSKSRMLQALMIAINKSPGKAAVIITLATIPISLKNYPWSLTDAPIRHIVAAQVVCVLPYCSFLVYIGHSSKSLVAVLHGKESPNAVHFVFTIVGVIVMAVAIVMVGRATKQQMDQMVEEASLSEMDDAPTAHESLPADADGDDVEACPLTTASGRL